MFRVIIRLTVNGCQEISFFCPSCHKLRTYYKVVNDGFGVTCPMICSGCQAILPLTNGIIDTEDLGAFHKSTYHSKVTA